MKRLIFVALLLPVAVSAQDSEVREPRFYITTGQQDTAWSSPFVLGRNPTRDTLTVNSSLGDTIHFQFQALDWPEVNGYHIDLLHRGWIQTPSISDWILGLIDYSLGSFLTDSTLPTSQEGVIHLNAATLQFGAVSLGERRGSGSGHLGTLSVVVDSLFANDIEFEIDGVGLQIPRDSTYADSIRARIKIQLPAPPPLPDPITADFNGNGTVDFQDFIVFAQNFGLHSDRDDNFDSRIDLVENGSIDFEDFLLFVSEFGKPSRIIRFASKRLP